MAKRVENECAFCAEELEDEQGIIGKDWKVYCSEECAQMGQMISAREMQQLMKIASANRVRSPARKAA